MLTGYESHTQAMKDFMKTKLFEKKYSRVINTIRESGNNKILSQTIEDLVEVSGSELRKLIQHARHMCLPVCSSGKGYWWGSCEDVESTITHFNERVLSLNFTMGRMKQTIINMNNGDVKIPEIKDGDELPVQMELFGGDDINYSGSVFGDVKKDNFLELIEKAEDKYINNPELIKKVEDKV